MGNSKKQYLTGAVHRLHDGVLESHYAGEAAPDWVTNAKILTDKPAHADEVDVVVAEDTSGPDSSTETAADDLAGLDGKALKKIADEVGVAKNGSLDTIRDRIRAKRAESTGKDGGDTEREALIEKLTAKGIEVDDQMSDAELEALDDDEE